MDGAQRAWHVGRSAKGANAAHSLARKIKIDSRIDTVRRLITTTETGELLIQPPGTPLNSSSNARWCDTKTFQGVTYLVEEDELILPNDPKGDTKITPEGVLLGGRQYKIPTFTSKNRANPNKHFMLSIDAARAAGYRDSLYFFRRNPLIQKLPCTQTEKDELIAAGFLSGNLKSRAVTMCSARNAFKVIGARFLKDGKHVIDDYYEDAAFASGAAVGEPAIADGLEPSERLTANAASQKRPPTPTPFPEPPEKIKLEPHQSSFRLGLNRLNPSQASSAGSGLKTIFGGDGKAPSIAIPNDSKERRRRMASHLTAKNWMVQYCRAISEMNRHLRGIRNERMIPFNNFPSIARLSEDSSIKERPADNAEDDGMEWREVEVDIPLNSEGKIMQPGDEFDPKGDQDDEGSNSDNALTLAPAPDASQTVLRITNALPLESTITIHGVGNSSLSQDNVNSGETPLGGVEWVRASGSGLHPARARSPHKRPRKSRPKKPQNDWWTTTIKVVEKRPKLPVMGLLDVHTGQPHVRQDTQPTMAIWEPVDEFRGWTPNHKRQKVTDSLEEPQYGCEERSKESCAVIRAPALRNSGLYSTNDVTLIEIVFDHQSTPQAELLPGMWDFRSRAHEFNTC